MVKLIGIKQVPYPGNILYELYADAKEDVIEGMTIIGLSSPYTLASGSIVTTSKGEKGRYKSTGEWDWEPAGGGGGGGSDLPEVTSEDNGKILEVVEGEWSKSTINIEDIDTRLYTAEDDIDTVQGQIGNNTLKTSVPQYDVNFGDHTYDADDGTLDGCILFKKNAMNIPNNTGSGSDVDPASTKNVKVYGWDSLTGSIPKTLTFQAPDVTMLDGETANVANIEFYNSVATINLIAIVSFEYNVDVTTTSGTVTFAVGVDGANTTTHIVDYSADGRDIVTLVVPFNIESPYYAPTANIGNHIINVSITTSGCSLS